MQKKTKIQNAILGKTDTITCDSVAQINDVDYEWSQAELKNMLNGYYIGEEASCTYCDGEICSISCNDVITPINSTYRSMVESVVWNTGATQSEETLLEIYNAERGSTTGKICTQGSEGWDDTVTRTTKWEGKIGLIYPSDFGYAGDSTCASIKDSVCSTSNWLNASGWTITPAAFSRFASNGLVINFEVTGTTDVYSGRNVLPSLYLKSNVKIIDGDGSRNNPYKLAI